MFLEQKELYKTDEENDIVYFPPYKLIYVSIVM